MMGSQISAEEKMTNADFVRAAGETKAGLQARAVAVLDLLKAKPRQGVD